MIKLPFIFYDSVTSASLFLSFVACTFLHAYNYLQLFCNVYVCLTCVYNFVFQLIFPVIFLKSVLFCLFVQPINWYSPLFLSLLCFYGGEITQWKKDLPPSYEWERVWMIDVLILGGKRLNPLDIRISVVILPTCCHSFPCTSN